MEEVEELFHFAGHWTNEAGCGDSVMFTVESVDDMSLACGSVTRFLQNLFPFRLDQILRLLRARMGVLRHGRV